MPGTGSCSYKRLDRVVEGNQPAGLTYSDVRGSPGTALLEPSEQTRSVPCISMLKLPCRSGVLAGSGTPGPSVSRSAKGKHWTSRLDRAALDILGEIITAKSDL